MEMAIMQFCEVTLQFQKLQHLKYLKCMYHPSLWVSLHCNFMAVFRKSAANGSHFFCQGDSLFLQWMHSNNGKYSAKPTQQQHTMTLAIHSISQCMLSKGKCPKQHCSGSFKGALFPSCKISHQS